MNYTSFTPKIKNLTSRFLQFNLLLIFLITSCSMNAFAQNCAITGAANVCPSDIKIYSINLTGCNGTPTGYLWSVTGNGSISGANNNATVSISWGAAGSGSVSVVVTTSSGSFNPLPLNVSISSLPTPIVTTDVDLECTVYIDGEHNGDPTIAPEECFQVCEYSTAHYQTPLNAGSTYSWVVNGALSNSAAQNQLTVLWGAYGTGTVEITETNSSGCSTTISYCITKVQKPGVLFSTIPLSNINYGTPLQICLGQTIYFFDESATSAYGSPIVSWFWDFGDGTTSILQNPEHIYQNAQDYDVTLTVTNACNCTNTISLHVIVDPQQWVDIECATPVCEGSTDTYFTNANCTQYNWIVTNGTIISPQPYGNNIQVLWGSGQNGPGVVSLSAVGCANNCPAMSSIVVPIFSNSVTISGTNPACTSQQTAYSVPMVPGSFYNWSVTPSGTIVSGQGTNQVIIDWGGYVGQANVHCDYQNIFLHCPEGATDLTVDVREEFTVTGPSDICQNLLGPITYTAQSNVGAAVFRFKIKNAAGSYVYNQPGPFSTSVTFNSWNWGAGIFTLEVYNYQGYFCNSPQTMQIKVNASPASPAAPTGDDEVCPSLPYLYSAPTLSSSTLEYVWNIIGGNTDAPNGTLTTAFGNSITVYWKSPYVPNSKVQLAILDKETGCQSLYTDFVVAPKLPIVPVIEGPRKTCLNTYSDYSIQNWPINSEKIEWEISPQQAGSIVTGQFTPNINVQWNNAVYSSVTLKLTSFTCGTPNVYTISINLNNNTLTTSIVPNPVCELALAAFNLTNVTGTPNNIITNWDFGDGYPSTTSSLSASHGFDITPQFGPVFNGNVTTHYDDPSVVGSVNNCMTGIFSVTAIPEPAVYISSNNGLPLCPGPNLLTANPANPATYEWSTGETTQAISVSSIATYTVTITDVGTGCTNSTNISLTDCNCIADATIPVNPFTDVNTTCGTGEFTATGNTSLYNYIINFGDGTADPITSFGTPTITHQYNSAGYYNV
ncbi:MAG: PKD domain-containing protein [Bacteroidetes bacterium]|nr:PKD domain-containing protein [Bacteroidota bacterium]